MPKRAGGLEGLTVWVCFGSYGGWRIETGSPTILRIVAGWVSFVVIGMDIDKLVGIMARHATRGLECTSSSRSDSSSTTPEPS